MVGLAYEGKDYLVRAKMQNQKPSIENRSIYRPT